MRRPYYAAGAPVFTGPAACTTISTGAPFPAPAGEPISVCLSRKHAPERRDLGGIQHPHNLDARRENSLRRGRVPLSQCDRAPIRLHRNDVVRLGRMG